jgi:hypothetical protein
MNDPYQVLGLGPDADAAAVRSRYLELVRRHSPEREPQRFAEIRAAYDRLRDPIVNLESRLFSTTVSHTLDALATERKPDVRARRLPTDLLLSLARS